MDKSRAHVYISGKVQGVGFRYNTYYEALKLNIKGWVKNTFDGKVEAIFEGYDESIETILSWCNTGPGTAKVTKIEIQKTPYMGEFEDFTIRG